MAINLATLLVRIRGSTAQLEKSITGVEKKLSRFGGRLQAQGAALTTGITAPLVAAGGVAVKFAGDFEEAMTRSTAIMGDLSQALRDDLERAARDAAKTTEFSAKQAAESFFFLASAGLDASESIEALPQVAKFATAGAFDLARATDLLTDAQSALGLSTSQLATVSDVLIKANTLANATAEQFSESLTTKAGPALRALGKDIEEGVAVLAAFADQGIKGSDAGTQLAIVLRDLTTKAIRNKKDFEELGVAVFDSSGEMRNIADILADLERALSGANDQTQKATLLQLGFADRSVAALQALIGLSDKVRDYEKELRIAGGTTDRVAEKQLNNFNSQLRLLGSRVADSAIQLGRVLLPILRDFFVIVDAGLQVIDRLVRAFAELPDFLQRVAVGFAALVAAIGPIQFVIGAVAKSVALLIKNFKLLAVVTGRVLTNPLFLLGAALGAAILSMDSFAEATERSAEALGEWSSVVREAQSRLNAAKIRIAELKDRIRELREELEKQTGVDFSGLTFGEIPEDLGGELRQRLGELKNAEKELAEATTDLAERVERQLIAALGKADAKFRVTGDELERAQSNLRAYREAIDALVGVLPEGNAQLEGYVQTARALDDVVGSLSEKQARVTASVSDSTPVLDRWVSEMERAQAIGRTLGDSQGQLQQEIALTEQAIIDLIDKQREQGSLTPQQAAALALLSIAYQDLNARQQLQNQLLQQNLTVWQQWFQQMEENFGTTTEIVQSFLDLTNEMFVSFADGLGNALGRIIVFGDDFQETMARFFNQLAANAISSLVSIGVQLLAFQLLTAAGLNTFAKLQATSQGARAFAGAAASAFETLPFPIAVAVAPIWGAAATAVTVAPALALAEGGIITQPLVAEIGEAGPEAVLPLERLEDMMETGAPEQTIIVQQDGRTVAKTVVKHMPSIVRMNIGPGL